MTLSDELALSRHAHDRVGDRRTDEEWVRSRWDDPASRVLLLHEGAVVLDDSGTAPTVVSPPQAGPGERLLLGVEDRTTYFAVLLDAAPAGMRTAKLREVAPELSDRDAGLVTHAVAMANWHRVHPHCPRCGGRLHAESAGHLRRCERCERVQFPRTDPAVIMLVLDEHDRCLLGHNTRSPRPHGFSTLAGFVEPGESLEHAVRREILEEVGIEVDEVTYMGSQPWPLPASLMVGFFARARTTAVVVDGDEIGEARWFDRGELLAATDSGEVVLPGRVSIARRLIETWYGGTLPGSW